MSYSMGYKELIAALNAENLSTYFLLPLLGLPKERFGGPNFCNSYITRDGKSIYVVVYDIFLLQDPSVLYSKLYRRHFETNDGITIQYHIPSKWKHEVQCYISGKYTLFTEEAKEIIAESSGLLYQYRDEFDILHTDPRLLALIRSKDLERWLENELNCPIAWEELLPPPKEDAFIQIN